MRVTFLASFYLCCALNSAWAGPFRASMACSAKESWEFPQGFPEKWRAKYLQYLADEKGSQTALTTYFSEALSLRASAEDSLTRKFAEFWIARVLLSAKLNHSALGGFKNVLLSSEGAVAQDRGLRLAALDCWVEIQRQFPSVPIDFDVVKTFLALSDGVTSDAWAAKTAAVLYVLSLQAGQTSSLDSLVLIARRDPTYGPLVAGLSALRRGALRESLSSLKVALQSNDLAPQFAAHTRLLLARAFFSTQNYQEAWAQLRLIPRNSPLFTTALTELAWTALVSGRYPDAVGVALSLQSGAFKEEFIPDAALVLAISFNEFCHYPAALLTVQNFKSRYREIFDWLQSQSQSAAQGGPSLYSMAIAHSQGQLSVPEPLVRQWMRLPAFIANQREINSLFDEDSRGASFSDALMEEKERNRVQIRERANALRPKLTAMSNSAEALVIRKAIGELKGRVVEYLNQKKANALWIAIYLASQRSASVRRKDLVTQISRHIRDENTELLRRLREAAQSLRLVEIEIFNGASHDMIFMNAHPDYSATLAKWIEPLKNEQADKKWLWGALPTDPEARVEIWADELGAIRANLPDHCTNKDKYLALKSVRPN
ncbi:hypothetical protein WDW86_18330 [Bdellovibrionota bacterium FG-2]